jgi:hypothetical protein
MVTNILEKSAASIFSIRWRQQVPPKHWYMSTIATQRDTPEDFTFYIQQHENLKPHV